MYVPRSKTVFSRRDPLAGGALDDTPNQCIWLYELAQIQSLNIFNISNYYTITLLHQFMSEITLHTTKTPKSYFFEKSTFLGGIGVDNNYIYNI